MKRLIFSLTVGTVLALTGCANVDTRTSPHYSSNSRPSARLHELSQGKGSPSRTLADRSQLSPVGTVGYLQDDANDDDGAQHVAPEPVVVPALGLVDPEVVDSSMDNSLINESVSYTLADIERLALGNNPAVLAAQATTGISSGLQRQVGTRPNPVLGYSGQQLADRNTDQNGIFIEQEFVRGEKLALNREVLAHTNRAQQLEVETQRYRVLTDVRVRFFEAVAAQQQHDVAQQFVEVALRGVEVAEERQQAGEGTLVETLQARTLMSEVTLSAEQAEVAYRGAWRDLAAIAGLPATSPARLSQDLSVPLESPDWEFTYSEILTQSPELATARAIVCEKQALVRRQKAQPISNVTAQLGSGYDNGTDNGFINLQLSAPIPFYNKNCGNISAAYHDYVRATRDVKRIEQSIRSRLARAAQEFDTAMASVRKYETEIIPQTKKSLDLSESAYRAGELEFLQVLIVRRSFYDSSLRLIQAKGQLAQAAAKVDGLLLTGGLEAPKNYTDGDGLRGASLGSL